MKKLLLVALLITFPPVMAKHHSKDKIDTTALDMVVTCASVAIEASEDVETLLVDDTIIEEKTEKKSHKHSKN